MYEKLIEKFVEIRMSYDYYYHGRFIEEDNTHFKIFDMKIGEIILNKSEVSYIRPMSRNNLIRFLNKLDTIEDRLNTGSEKLRTTLKNNFQENIEIMKKEIRGME